jgi:hypothetical protein
MSIVPGTMGTAISLQNTVSGRCNTGVAPPIQAWIYLVSGVLLLEF